jgi:hypothetical protein
MSVKNIYRMRVAEIAEQEGYSDVLDFVENCCMDSVIPACCTEGYEVEPDGHCEHGCPSVLLALGMI